MIEIQQRTSHPSVDFFELPVPIRLAGQGRDTILVFDHRFSGQRFTVELPFKVEEMTFDPDLWLLSKGNEVNLLLVGTGTAQQERQPFVLSPNPARGSVQINGGGDAGMQALQVTLYDGLGRMVRQTLFPAGSRELSLDGLPGGIYFCHLLMGNERQVLRLVVSE